MKMSFVKKLLVRVYWVCSVISLLALLITSVFPQLARAFSNSAGLLAVGIIYIVAYVLLAVAMGMMLFAKKPAEDEQGFITVESLETGKVKVAIAAIDQMIRQAAKGVDGISDMKAEIENNGDSVSIDTSVIVRSGMHIPTVTANMQNAIRGYIERNCGVAVREVSVSVRLVDDGETVKRGRRKPAPVAQIEQPKEAPAEEPAFEEAACADVSSEEIDVAELFSEGIEAEVEDTFGEEISLTLDPCADGEAAEEAESIFDETEDAGKEEETEITE